MEGVYIAVALLFHPACNNVKIIMKGMHTQQQQPPYSAAAYQN
jgi:hypothetical protein